ncbi:MAG TPA: hypothetical protein VGJ00_03150 [Rhabdochlamydiaceae bacterium]|jgi:hypothetical protein
MSASSSTNRSQFDGARQMSFAALQLLCRETEDLIDMPQKLQGTSLGREFKEMGKRRKYLTFKNLNFQILSKMLFCKLIYLK